MNWEEIRKEYETTDITLKALAEKYGIKSGTLKSRKSREKWKKDATLKKKDAKKVAKDASKKTKSNEVVESLVESDELTDKQRLFCIYYIKSFNATQAAINAGYAADSAHVEGNRLLRNAKVAEEIKYLKGAMAQKVFLDAMDVLNEYIKMAFADITDFITFYRKDIVTGEVEALLNSDDLSVKDIVPMLQSSNEVYFKDMDQVDGRMISEVKKSKDGISIKLHDKMKALEKLERYFDLLPDQHKRMIETAKSELDQKKYELDKRRVELSEREQQNKEW
ncbi:terminase small subunit [Chengkuizengella axinellae]|uniref:Terminase small subunit n=1 Tax=Chengkuizengella axinellae TaxID=3064388 RepID=A0ABT9IXC4_9BACL|nr:terminase small subunit [Chengkuizengella sp. 2205SS18-9]MDP5274014.1 terminase small subunit [Chengkuizengella sp. 2205SS18-9]